MRVRRALLCALASGVAALGALAQDSARLREDVERAVVSAVEAHQTPGAAVLIGRGDELLLLAAFGARALEPQRELLTLDTIFDLASLTKPIATATSIMVLVDRGDVALDAPAARYLPEFGTSGKERITVEQLLRHWSGLTADNALADYADGPAKARERVCELAPQHEPGTRFVYSDVGYIVLGQLVERVSGQPLDIFAKTHIFEPLGMRETGFRPIADLAARCAPTERRGERWMRGEVHDPRAFALGGVAGHAGLFSTLDDVARWCRMLLGGGELEGRRVLSEAAVRHMLTPRSLPDGSGTRTLGLDCDTGYSSARGDVFPRGESVGHTGFTGTALWLDPQTRGYVVTLANGVHPDGRGDLRPLRRALAGIAGRALRPDGEVLTGLDVLVRDSCALLAGRKVALLTNATGLTREGERTVDALLRNKVEVVCLLAPEHGLASQLDGPVGREVDAATGLVVHSLYGETRRPTRAMLAGCDTLVFDVQDAGTRIYTYETTLGYAMEAAAELGLRVVVLDRPNPIGAVPLAGPCADADRLDFTSYRPIPLVHGLTIGELATLYREHFGVACELQVVRCRNWRRAMWWDETGLPWVNPSPNLRNPTQALLYPGVALLETTNVSVGRGTDEPFERFGAPWIDGAALARELNAARIPGLRFVEIAFTPSSSRFAGEPCRGVHIVVTERAAVRPVEAGLAFARALAKLAPERFEAERVDVLLRSRATHAAWKRGASDSELRAGWSECLRAFEFARRAALLYP